MYSSVIQVTPELAARWLEKRHPNQRKLKGNTVGEYAAMMRRGEWQLSPQGVSFSESGFLIDGQHRLAAVVRSGCTVPMYVTFDAPDNIYILDAGAARTPTDVVGMTGIKLSNAETAAIRFLIRWLGEGAEKNIPLITRIAEQHAGSLRDAYLISCRGITGSKPGPMKTAPCYAAVWSAMMCGVDRGRLDAFCTVANSGFSTAPEDTAAIVLRNALADMRTNWPDNERKFVLAQMAISDYMAGKPRRFLWKDPKAVYFDGKIPENLIRAAVADKPGKEAVNA